MVYATGNVYRPTRRGWRKRWETKLPARFKPDDPPPGRSGKKSGGQYLSPYSTYWGVSDRTPASYSSYSQIKRTDYVRPNSYLGWPANHDKYYRSSSPSYRLSDYGYGHYSDYRTTVHGTEYRPRAYSSRSTVWTDLSMRYQKIPKYCSKSSEGYGATYRRDEAYSPRYAFGDPTAPDLGGWRARLAREGYVPSTVRKRTALVPDRRWQYLDEDEMEETTEGFEHRTSRGTCEQSRDQPNSVISRTKRMKLESAVTKATTAEVEIQVDPEDIAKYYEMEQKRLKRGFISSRYQLSYGTGSVSYNKYLSPMPWRGSNSYSIQRLSGRNAREGEPASDHKASHVESTNKDFRKSVLNVDLTDTEAHVFARKQAETRYRRATDDYISEDGSPSETGYESHSSCTDVEADRSSVEAESLFTDSIDRSYTELRGSYKSSRSTPFGDDVLFMEGTDSRMSCLTDSQVPLGIFSPDPDFISLDKTDSRVGFFNDADVPLGIISPDPDIIIQEKDMLCYHEEMFGNPVIGPQDLCFRFKSLNESASQRDSGFSELYSVCDSDVDSTDTQTKPVKEISRFIGELTDIDSLLTDRDLDVDAFQTFEDFEMRIERHKNNIRTKGPLSTTPSTWSKPKTVGLHLDLGRNRFIGSCRDIDEMLGMPTPISPEEQSEYAIGVILEESTTEEEDGVNTAATSVGVADLACFGESAQMRNRSSSVETWQQVHRQDKEIFI